MVTAVPVEGVLADVKFYRQDPDRNPVAQTETHWAACRLISSRSLTAELSSIWTLDV
jgi:hypothetical protein